MTMGLGGLGYPELLVILLIVMILFGANRLPTIGSSLGEAIKNFKKGMKPEAAKNDSEKKTD